MNSTTGHRSTTGPGPSRARRVRTGLLLATTALALAACGDGDRSATNHLGFEDGAGPPAENGLTTIQALLIYTLAPLAILLLVAALVWLPGMVRSNRYRPTRGWNAPPLWFGGPADPAAAVEAASPGDVVRGGASGNW